MAVSGSRLELLARLQTRRDIVMTMVIGAVGALTVNSLDLLGKRASVRDWYSGTAVDSKDTLLFSLAWNNDLQAKSSLPVRDHRKAGFGRRPDLPELAQNVSLGMANYGQLLGAFRKIYARYEFF